MDTIKLTLQDIENLPNFKKRTSSGEYSSACPLCGGEVSRDTDRFRFWMNDGNYWCRQCGLSGFIVDDSNVMTNIEWVTHKKVVLAKAKERRSLELQAISKKIEQMNAIQDDIIYHEALMRSDDMLSYVMARWGLSVDVIKQRMIGYANECPTYTKSDSITIPVYYRNSLYNIKHRLLRNDGSSGKYRPHISGLPAALYNVNTIDESKDVIIVEGEFKSMVIEDRTGVPTVGAPSATIFKDKWAKFFRGVNRVYVMLDPDAIDRSSIIASKLKGVVDDVRIALIPVKPDDFFVLHNGTKKEFMYYLQFSRRV